MQTRTCCDKKLAEATAITACAKRSEAAYLTRGTQAMCARHGSLAKVTRTRQRQSFLHMHTRMLGGARTRKLDAAADAKREHTATVTVIFE